jgi:hypothetical protein
MPLASKVLDLALIALKSNAKISHTFKFTTKMKRYKAVRLNKAEFLKSELHNLRIPDKLIYEALTIVALDGLIDRIKSLHPEGKLTQYGCRDYFAELGVKQCLAGRALQGFRLAYGLTLLEMAKRVGKCAPTLCRIEAGELATYNTIKDIQAKINHPDLDRLLNAIGKW